MALISQPYIGATIWTLAGGLIVQRVYAGKSLDGAGFILKIPGKPIDETGYFVPHLFAYEFKSDILEIHLTAAKRTIATAQAQLPALELEYLNALKHEGIKA